MPQLGIVIAISESDGASARERLAGLGLAMRAVLTLQQMGAERMVLALRPSDADLVEGLAADPRCRAALSACLVEEGVPVFRALAEVIDERFLLARHDLVVDPAIYRQLALAGDDEGRVATREGEPLGPLCGTPMLLERARDVAAADLLGVEGVAAWDVGDHWVCRIDSEAGRRCAVHHLFEACRKPVDGFVSRHFNRHLSLWISRRLVNLPITPNAMTMVTFGVSVLAAWFAIRGDYASTLIAAALMQLNSILDGCDGELARVRFQGSTLGQWLDTIGDDASNVLFWAALAIGAGRQAPLEPWLATSGWVAAAANALAASVNYAVLAKMGSGDFYALAEHDAEPASGWLGKLIEWIGLLLKQDSFLMLVLLVAATGYLHQVLPLIALGAVITAVNALVRGWRARQSFQSRSRTMS